MKEERRNYSVHILLTIIALLLLVLLFKEDIQSYFKNREVLKKNQAKSQEVIQKANIFNIVDVASDCIGYLTDDSGNSETSGKCETTMTNYGPKIERWQDLIKENWNINCQDFSKKKDAQDFYEYVSGEYAHEYIGYKQYIKENPSKALEDDGSGDLVFQASSDFDGCHYDPYGLDTNSDCNACENLK